MNFLFYCSLILFFLNCFILAVLVLVQESRSLGLGASFGGDAGSSLFGTSTADILKKLTAISGVVFAALCFILSIWTSASQEVSLLDTPLVEQLPEG